MEVLCTDNVVAKKEFLFIRTPNKTEYVNYKADVPALHQEQQNLSEVTQKEIKNIMDSLIVA